MIHAMRSLTNKPKTFRQIQTSKAILCSHVASLAYVPVGIDNYSCMGPKRIAQFLLLWIVMAQAGSPLSFDRTDLTSWY